MPVDMQAVQEELARLEAESKAREEREKNRGKGGKWQKAKYLKMDAKEIHFRILPPFGDRKLPWLEILKVNVGPFGKSNDIVLDVKTPDVSPRLNEERKKALAAANAVRDDEKKNKELYKKYTNLKGTKRLKIPGIRRGQEAEGVQVWECSSNALLQELMGFFNNPDYGDFTDPQTGFDLVIKPYPKADKKAPAIQLRRNPSRLLDDAEKLKELLATDWIETYSLTRTSDEDYINAVFDDRVTEFFAEVKAKNKAKREAQGQPKHEGGQFPAGEEPLDPDGTSEDLEDALRA